MVSLILSLTMTRWLRALDFGGSPCREEHVGMCMITGLEEIHALYGTCYRHESINSMNRSHK